MYLLGINTNACKFIHTVLSITYVMSLTVKASLQKSWQKEPLEIRRFLVDQDVSTSYNDLLKKVAEIFPSVDAEKVDTAWIGKPPSLSPNSLIDSFNT